MHSSFSCTSSFQLSLAWPATLGLPCPPTLLQVHGPSIQASLLYWPLDQYLLLWLSGSLSTPPPHLHLSLSSSLSSLTSLSWVLCLSCWASAQPLPRQAGGRGQLPPSLPCPGLAPKSGLSWRRPAGRGDAGEHRPGKGPASHWSPQSAFLVPLSPHDG